MNNLNDRQAPYVIKCFDNANYEECLIHKDGYEHFFKDNQGDFVSGKLYLIQMEYASCLNRIIELKDEAFKAHDFWTEKHIEWIKLEPKVYTVNEWPNEFVLPKEMLEKIEKNGKQSIYDPDLSKKK